MLRFCFSLAMTALLISCKNSDQKEAVIDYTGFEEKMITLAGLIDSTDKDDTLGSISIKLPARLDTMYQWHHYSDCKTCGEIKYRVADNSYDQYAESGFYWTVVPDSVYQFNIWHKPYPEVPDSIEFAEIAQADSSIYFNRLPELVSTLGDVDFFKREFKKIGDRNFMITGFVAHTGYLTRKKSIYLVALTNLRSRPLYLIAECSATDTTGFINNMYKSILSVQITEK
jgi:hypothetical protein